MNKIKIYKNDFDYSYVIGASPTIELLKTKPEIVRGVFVHSKFHDKQLIESFKIPVLYDDKTFERLGVNDNSYVIGVFDKFANALNPNKPHIMLVNPSDMGNLGNICRTVLGFGYTNLAVIKPAADIFNPKTVRASMGAIFKINFELFDTFEQYKFAEHQMFPFMLGGKLILDECPSPELHTLIFGNESSGLDSFYTNVGTSVRIPQSEHVDSHNLCVAVGIGAYTFAVRNNLLY